MKTKNVVGYIRVSSAGQRQEGESLSTQKKSIHDKCKYEKWKLKKIYADEGISGKSIKARPAFMQMMDEIKSGKIDYLVINKLSRLGRNCRELLTTVETLKEYKTTLVSLKESIDLSTPLGNLLFQVLGSVAEFERETIREQTLENKIARTQKGIPSAGRLPYGRSFDRETGQWSVDKEKAQLVKNVATRYLKGESAKVLAKELGISYSYLIRIFKDLSGDKWTVNFKGYDPIAFHVPPLLDDPTIDKLKARINHNMTFNRADSKQYVLSGFIRCMDCLHSLNGQTQIQNGKEWQYYRHYYKCAETRFAISLPRIEQVFFEEIRKFVHNGPAFEEAAKRFLPDKNYVKNLQDEISILEKAFNQANKKLSNFLDAIAEGHLKKTLIGKKQTEILTEIESIQSQLDDKKDQLNNLPDSKKFMQDAEELRSMLMAHYQSKKTRPKTFEDKKRFLHWLFDGKDKNNVPYGIYVKKINDLVYMAIYSSMIYGRYTFTSKDIFEGWKGLTKTQKNYYYHKFIEFISDDQHYITEIQSQEKKLPH